MDFWVVATAAGAGCLAKYWQKLLKDGNSSSQVGSRNSNFEKPKSSDYPFRRTAQRKKAIENFLTDEGEVLNGISSVMSQSADTGVTGCEKVEILGNYQDCDGLNISNLPPESSRRILQTFPHECSLNENMDDSLRDLLPSSSSRELNCFQPTLRRTGSFRSKHSSGRFIKPVSSLESCVLSHLYREHVEMEEYILHSLQSPSSSTTRRLIVNDGTQRINRVVRDSFSVQVDMDLGNFHKEAFLEKNRNVYGVPLPQKIRSLKTSEIPKTGRRKDGVSSAPQMHNENFFHAKDQKILFCIGVAIGLISSMTNKHEIDKLKEMLKHTENLVQDLQEELEMKDSLTVKELSNENCESQDISEISSYDTIKNECFPEQNLDNSVKFVGKELFEHKAEKSSESLSKIEAELEAELQMLGLNIEASNMDRRFSDLPELDSEFTRDFSEGEWKVNMISGQSATQPSQNQAVTENTCSGNYAVSPRELTVRLHEVIQSRLEARVRELKAALEESERKLQLVEAKHKSSSNKLADGELQHMEAEHNISWNELVPCESQYSSSEENLHVQPLVMNLAGEAMDAYNEAYKELTNMDDSEEEIMNSPSGINESQQQQSQIAINGYPFTVPNGTTTTIGRMIDSDKTAGEDLYDMSAKKGNLLLGQQANDVNGSGDEGSDYDDEMEKQLIKQIVEKTKKGSPVVLNAQRWLFSLDKDDGCMI